MRRSGFLTVAAVTIVAIAACAPDDDQVEVQPVDEVQTPAPVMPEDTMLQDTVMDDTLLQDTVDHTAHDTLPGS
jgi:hypothetical protein